MATLADAYEAIARRCEDAATSSPMVHSEPGIMTSLGRPARARGWVAQGWSRSLTGVSAWARGRTPEEAMRRMWRQVAQWHREQAAEIRQRGEAA